MGIRTTQEVLEPVKAVFLKGNKIATRLVTSLIIQSAFTGQSTFVLVCGLLGTCLLITLLWEVISTIDFFALTYGLASWGLVEDSPVDNAHLGFLYEKQRF